jgi:hypothetical protein
MSIQLIIRETTLGDWGGGGQKFYVSEGLLYKAFTDKFSAAVVEFA